MEKQEIFKVNDWVVLKEEFQQKISSTDFNTPFQIEKITERFLYKKNGNNRYTSEFRHALPHEIPEEFKENVLKSLIIW